jgi:hypothetical protein
MQSNETRINDEPLGSNGHVGYESDGYLTCCVRKSSR